MNIIQRSSEAVHYFAPPLSLNSLATVAKNFFLDYSIFRACDPQWLAANKAKLSSLSFTGKLQHSAKVATVCIIRKIIFMYAVSAIFYRLITWVNGRAPEEKKQYMREVLKKPILFTIGLPIFEELFFRGLLFNADTYLQKGIAKLTPSCLQKNCLYRGLSSPGFPHVENAANFALLHLENIRHMSPDKGITHILLHFIFTSTEFSILYASTGTIFAPITAHIINNTLAILLTKITKK